MCNIKRVYCSGPLFSPEEVETMTEIAGVLEEKGYTTYLPHRDGVEAFIMNTVNSPLTNAFIFRPVVKLVSKAIFALDVFQIEQCDGFVCNLNGRVPDEGAVVEAAMALAWGKPVVFYRSDCRRLYGNGDNPVIAGASSFKTVSEIREIPGELERLPGSFSPALRPEQLPPFVRKVHRFGEAAWKLTQRFRFLRPKNCLVD